ncbi:hypothetical protein ScalyP_jg5166 [Parmales sp. scaly parma]|nr:hypothetical protein ScalyP_jg5166 [Parmales sp. scaly parma]
MAGSRKNTTGSTSRNFLRKSCEETSFNQRHIGNHGFQRDPSSIAESKSSKGKSTKVGAQNKQQERRHQDLLYQQSQVLEGIDNVYPPIVITESNDNEEITLAGIPTTSNASMPKEQQKLYNKKALHVKRAMAVELAITTRSKFERSEATGTSIVDASEEKGYGNAEVIKDNLYLLGKAEESGFNSSTGMKKYNKLTNKQFSYLSTTDFRSNHLHSKLQLLKGSNKYKLQYAGDGSEFDGNVSLIEYEDLVGGSNLCAFEGGNEQYEWRKRHKSGVGAVSDRRQGQNALKRKRDGKDVEEGGEGDGDGEGEGEGGGGEDGEKARASSIGEYDMQQYADNNDDTDDEAGGDGDEGGVF